MARFSGVFDCFLPDLKVDFDQINLPQTIEFGDDGRVKVTVTNQGILPALGSVRLNLYGATDTKINRNPETNDLVNDVLLTSERRFLALGNGESKTFTLKYDNITSFGAPGAYNLIAEVVPGRIIPEAKKTNNVVAELVSAPGTDAVIDWNATLLNAVQANQPLDANPLVGVAPAEGTRATALVHAAIYDAVNGIKGGFTPYAVNIAAPENASARAAVVGAAYRTLTELFPGQTEVFDAQLEKSLAEIPDSRRQDRGFAYGQRVARRLLALRANDLDVADPDTDYSYNPPDGEYVWRPGENGIALGAGYGTDAVPFAIPNTDQFAPDGLDGAFKSDLYAEEIEEVRGLGARENTDLTTITRTPDQTEAAIFWAYDRADTFRPYGQLNQIAQEVAVREGNTLMDNARLFAQLNIALSDSIITAWDAKYEFLQPRPDDVITGDSGLGNAFDDGRDDTVGDPDWQPLLPTPPFPDYISGHSVLGGAFGAVLTDFFGENYKFDAVSQELPGVVRSFDSFNQAGFEDAISRIYGGVHVREATITDALPIGQAIGNFVVNNVAQPIV